MPTNKLMERRRSGYQQGGVNSWNIDLIHVVWCMLSPGSVRVPDFWVPYICCCAGDQSRLLPPAPMHARVAICCTMLSSAHSHPICPHHQSPSQQTTQHGQDHICLLTKEVGVCVCMRVCMCVCILVWMAVRGCERNSEPCQGVCVYSRTSVQRNSLSRTSRLAGRWLDWTSGCRGQTYCIVSRKLTFNLYFSAISLLLLQ